jgi:hypothetical protein
MAQAHLSAIQPEASSRLDVQIRSALADKIVALCRSGALPSPFAVNDIRKHFHDDYTENHIRSVMANYCSGTGYWATESRTARFKRHSRGKYLCL